MFKQYNYENKIHTKTCVNVKCFLPSGLISNSILAGCRFAAKYQINVFLQIKSAFWKCWPKMK